MKVDECEYTKTGSKRKGKRKKMLNAKLADFIATSQLCDLENEEIWLAL